MAQRREFGRIRQTGSKRGKRYQAFYDDPERAMKVSKNGNLTPVLHKAPHTFGTKMDAEAWLSAERRLISSGKWTPPAARAAQVAEERTRGALTFGKYAETWMKERRNSRGQPLGAQTRDKYEGLLRRHILPTFKERPLASITRAEVKAWHKAFGNRIPTERAHAYNLLRSIMKTAAEDDELIPGNPVYIRGAGQRHTKRRVKPASLDELAIMLVETPPRYRLMIQFGAWCALRFGEDAELRRSDFEFGKGDDGQPFGWIRVSRGVGIARGDLEGYELPPDAHWCPCRRGCLVGSPKTEAGIRDVAIPPFLLPEVKAHLLEHTAPGADGLLFPSPINPEAHLSQMTFLGRSATYEADGKTIKRAATGFVAAREAAGRADLDFHDLRHTGASMAGKAGASMAELMHRLGHTTPSMAMVYQHSSRDRDAELARKLSDMATPGAP